jgi:hypothetical protein
MFDMSFRDHRKLNSFIKILEGMITHSDTALLKVKARGIYILITDFESMCCCETRITKVSDLKLKIKEEFSGKFLLDSLIEELRTSLRNKRNVLIFGDEKHNISVKDILPNNTYGDIRPIKSAEHRMRVYCIISTREFIEQSTDWCQFKMINAEFNKIITSQTIISGIAGGIGKLKITPTSKTNATITFSLENKSGGRVSLKIETFTNSEDVPILKIPKEEIEVSYLLTYLKRSQNILSNPNEFVTLYLSKKGILLAYDSKDFNSCTLIYTINVAEKDENNLPKIDLDSYV